MSGESVPAPEQGPPSRDRTRDLGAIVRHKLATGELPKGEEARLTLNLGPISPCDACGSPITGLEHVAELYDGRKFRFHAPCIVVWERERLAGGERPRLVTPRPDWEGNDSQDVDREARCAACGSPIPPFASRYRVQSVSFHPECYDRAPRGDGAA